MYQDESELRRNLISLATSRKIMRSKCECFVQFHEQSILLFPELSRESGKLGNPGVTLLKRHGSP